MLGDPGTLYNSVVVLLCRRKSVVAEAAVEGGFPESMCTTGAQNTGQAMALSQQGQGGPCNGQKGQNGHLGSTVSVRNSSELLCRMVGYSMLHLLRNKLFPQGSSNFTCPPEIYEGSSFSTNTC